MENTAMSTFEICRSIMFNLLARAGEVTNYNKSWSKDFSYDRIASFPETIKKAEWFVSVDPSDLTKEEMVTLGFRPWSDESEMMLIPLWYAPFLKHGIEVECINGERYYFDETTDLDHRGGVLAFGVYPKK